MDLQPSDMLKPAGTALDAVTLQFLDEAAQTRSLRAERVSESGELLLTTSDFARYLGLDLMMEPELTWIAREMMAAPMPPHCEMLVSRSNVVYFHDLENDYYVLEHPLTQRYLKLLEVHRLELLTMRTRPSVYGLTTAVQQPLVAFHRAYRNLQLPCEDCWGMQSVVTCEQCEMQFCQGCFDLWHKNAKGPRAHHTTRPTAVGSLCSSCPPGEPKKPHVYCASCADHFCFSCFSAMHRRGNRNDHKAVLLTVSDGEVVNSDIICEECTDRPAAFRCDQCMDFFCATCFWRCHLNGARRSHTVTKSIVSPLCNQCCKIRATLFCMQCQELLCSECFMSVHVKGNRQLHMATDATNLLLLLEKLDPTFQEHQARARARVLWAVSQLQAWTRGIEARMHFRKRRDLVTKIQRRWRGAMTRRKLLAMLDHFRWRKRVVAQHLIGGRTRHDRAVLRQKFQLQMAQKNVSAAATKATLEELKNTIIATSSSNPMENVSRTKHTMMNATAGDVGGAGGAGGAGGTSVGVALPVYANASARFGATAPGGLGNAPTVLPPHAATLGMQSFSGAVKDDTTLRELLRIDDRVDLDTLEEARYVPADVASDGEDGTDGQQKQTIVRHLRSYRSGR